MIRSSDSHANRKSLRCCPIIDSGLRRTTATSRVRFFSNTIVEHTHYAWKVDIELGCLLLNNRACMSTGRKRGLSSDLEPSISAMGHEVTITVILALCSILCLLLCLWYSFERGEGYFFGEVGGRAGDDCTVCTRTPEKLHAKRQCYHSVYQRHRNNFRMIQRQQF